MIKIENRKHFNAILVHLKTTADILKHLDQLLATNCGSREMLLNSIRLKAPEIHQAVTAYCSAMKTETGKANFAEWAAASNLVPPGALAKARTGRDIFPSSKAVAARAKMRQGPAIDTCPYCGQKTNDLSTHSCNRTSTHRKKRRSVWVISGGGANGIRNRR